MLDFNKSTQTTARIHIPISATKISEALGGQDALAQAIRTQHPNATEDELKRIFSGEEGVAIVPNHPYVDIKLHAQVRDELGDPSTADDVAQRLAKVGGANAQNTVATAVLKIVGAGGDWRYARAHTPDPESWPKWTSLPLSERVDLAANLERTVILQMFDVLGATRDVEEEFLGKCLSPSLSTTTTQTPTNAQHVPSKPPSVANAA